MQVPESMRLQIGQIVSDYEVIGVLGVGGMGSVYKVRNTISDRVDAMKILLPDLRSSPELADRFLKEIKVLASLSHPNIAALHTALRVDNQLLMIMELVEGESVELRLSRGPIPPRESIDCIAQVLSALEYAHQRGVVHRDIKPANIAMTPQGVVKLLDFGIARAGSLKLTKTGMVMGSIYYMSPEQVRGQTADGRSDLYSVGLTLYRMITGRRPIDGDSEFAVMQAQVAYLPAPPKDLDATIPQELSNIIMRSLRKDPADRFQTAGAFRAALEPYLQPESKRSGRTDQTPLPSSIQHLETVTYAMPPPSTSSAGAIFDPRSLAVVQKHLAEVMGPIAGALIKKQSRSASSLSDLCQQLAGQISDEARRRTFLKACRTELGTAATPELAPISTSGTPAPSASHPVVWDPAMLERSRKDLVAYVGPVARLIVDRAAKTARSTEELYALISAEIPSQKDREKFLSSR